MSSERFFYTSLLLICLLFISCAYAGNTPGNTLSDPDEANPDAAAAWENARPVATKYDWVQLTSGEWLKGEIKGLYNKSLEFDSDKLGLLNIDWEDVSYVKTHIPGSAKLEGNGNVYGYFEITPDKIVVTNDGRVEEYDRSLIVSFITGGEEEKDFWTAKFTLGLNVRSGNTDQVDYTAKTKIKRETSFSRYIMDYIGNISSTSGDETSNNHRVTGSYDIFITRRFFVRPLFGEYFRDPFQNIDYKVTIGTGVGYTLIDTSKTEWGIVGGPGYQETRFESVLPGEDDKETTPALVLGTDFDTELTNWIDYLFNYQITWVNQESGGYTHHLVTSVEIDLIKSFDLDISFIWDHINNPTEADDGTIPEKDDYRIMFGVSYDF